MRTVIMLATLLIIKASAIIVSAITKTPAIVFPADFVILASCSVGLALIFDMRQMGTDSIR